MQIVLTEVKPLASLSSRRPAIYAYDYTAQSHTMQMPSVPVARFHYEPSPMQVDIGPDQLRYVHCTYSTSDFGSPLVGAFKAFHGC